MSQGSLTYSVPAATVASILTWPMVVLILGIVAILVFRRELRSLIERTERIRAPGVGIQAAARQTKPDAVGRENASEAAEELRRMFDNQLLIERAQLITSDLDKREVRGEEREKFLTRLAAATGLMWQFETAYNAIWGSQLELLALLNTLGPQGLAGDEIRPFYDGAARKFPAMYQTYGFDQWIAFLQGTQLILPKEDNRFAVTVQGREFLKYLVERGYTTMKPF
jgi:hypothetical protein